tara:strand:- start:154 stop:402 length:249 start_codon:yes stop_codon:yes gene_type:complete
MNKITQNEVILIIQKALNLKSGLISIKSSANNVKNWDSLGQLNILVALDSSFNGKISNIEQMATANSVKSIINLLKKNSLLK